METVYLHWNIANWITVVLMAAVGFMVLSLAAQFYHSSSSSKAA